MECGELRCAKKNTYSSVFYLSVGSRVIGASGSSPIVNAGVYHNSRNILPTLDLGARAHLLAFVDVPLWRSGQRNKPYVGSATVTIPTHVPGTFGR